VVIVVSTAVLSLPTIFCRAPRPQLKARTGRSVMTVVVAVSVLIGIAGCWWVQSEPSESNPAHAFYASLSAELAVNADQSAADCVVSRACPQAFAMAVLPLSATALVALGTAVVVTTIVGSIAHDAALARRGPPRGVAAALTGRDILTRFCLSRR
jgi:lipoprotein LpqS